MDFHFLAFRDPFLLRGQLLSACLCIHVHTCASTCVLCTPVSLCACSCALLLLCAFLYLLVQTLFCVDVHASARMCITLLARFCTSAQTCACMPTILHLCVSVHTCARSCVLVQAYPITSHPIPSHASLCLLVRAWPCTPVHTCVCLHPPVVAELDDGVVGPDRGGPIALTQCCGDVVGPRPVPREQPGAPCRLTACGGVRGQRSEVGGAQGPGLRGHWGRGSGGVAEPRVIVTPVPLGSHCNGDGEVRGQERP